MEPVRGRSGGRRIRGLRIQWDLPAAPLPQDRRLQRLSDAEAWASLGSVVVGRIAFTWHGTPTIRPVHHLLDGRSILIRADQGTALAYLAVAAEPPGPAVAYEADAIDPDTHLGWSVVATGHAFPVDDQAEQSRYEQQLAPWALTPAPAPAHSIVRITIQHIDAYALRAQ